MRLYITITLLFAVQFGFAQLPFTDGNTKHIRTILDGKASILVPDGYSYSRPFWSIDEQFTDAALYTNQKEKAGFACNLFKKPRNQEELYQSYIETKEANTTHYVDILRDEFVRKEEDSYFIYAFKLKDEFYQDGGNAFETSDGKILINYVCFYWVLQNNIASQIVFDYSGKVDSLSEFQQLAQEIISSYHLN